MRSPVGPLVHLAASPPPTSPSACSSVHLAAWDRLRPWPIEDPTSSGPWPACACGCSLAPLRALDAGLTRRLPPLGRERGRVGLVDDGLGRDRCRLAALELDLGP